VTPGRRINGHGLAIAPLAKDRGLSPGEISRDALVALRPDAQPASNDPRDLLKALRLSDMPLGRSGGATFVTWIAGADAGPGRYFVVVEGVGLPDSLK
jgi:hypothetical protein